MKKEIAKKWVKELRSGKYRQGSEFLKQPDYYNKSVQHCCLGVLCELYNKEMKKNKGKTLKESYDEGVYYFNKSYEVLPYSVKKWAGLKDVGGEFRNKTLEYGDEVYSSLAEMNDGLVSFKRIATVIEKNVENL